MKISIVTISYNQSRFVTQTIQSVVTTKYPLEYIVVDPGFNDGSRDIISSFFDIGKISKVIFETDKGPSDGLNKGFESATGDIFGYINSDDYFEPGALDYVCNFFEENENIDILLGGIKIVNEAGIAKLRKRVSSKYSLDALLSNSLQALQPATFFRKKVFSSIKFNIQNKTSWDHEYLVDAAIHKYKFFTKNIVLGNFRLYSGTITSNIMAHGPSIAWQANHDRIVAKILTSGYSCPNSFNKYLKYLLWRFSIQRRLNEFFLPSP